MGTGEFNAGDNPVMDQHPISGGGGGSNTSSHFILQKSEVSAGLIGMYGLYMYADFTIL